MEVVTRRPALRTIVRQGEVESQLGQSLQRYAIQSTEEQTHHHKASSVHEDPAKAQSGSMPLMLPSSRKPSVYVLKIHFVSPSPLAPHQQSQRRSQSPSMSSFSTFTTAEMSSNTETATLQSLRAEKVPGLKDYVITQAQNDDILDAEEWWEIAAYMRTHRRKRRLVGDYK